MRIINLRQTKIREPIKVHRHCLMFFTDETGHEEFADPKFPIFGMGGCALLAAAIDPVLRQPWREMKARHFGGADTSLHAADLRSPTDDQVKALGEFFESQEFGRFAITMTDKTELPDGMAREHVEIYVPVNGSNDPLGWFGVLIAKRPRTRQKIEPRNSDSNQRATMAVAMA
jgi:hypothetical protein